MTFSLENYFRQLIINADGIFNSTWLWASTFWLCLLFLVVLHVVLAKEQKLIPDFLFIILAGVFIFIFRLPSLAYGESNPDESQWLATVITMRHELNFYLSNFYIYDFYRALTIFPLWVISFTGVLVDYGLAKLTGIICWVVFITSYFYFIKDCFGRRTALLSSSIVAAFLATFTLPDYIAYNSEAAAVMFVVVFLFVFNRSIQKNNRFPAPSFFSGFTLALPLFAKEQTAYVVVGVGIICVLVYFFRKEFKNILLFFTGFILCCGVFIAPFFIFNKPSELVDWIVRNTNYLSIGLDFNHIKWSDRLTFRTIENSVYFYSLPLLFLLELIIVGGRNFFNWVVIKTYRFPLMLTAALYIGSFYTIVSSSDFFPHYSIYFILPTACLIALCINATISMNYRKTLAVFVPVCFLFLAKPGLDELNIQLNANVKKITSSRSVLAEEIIKNSSPGDKMLVWGWDCKLYVDTNLIRGSRFWYNQFLSPIYPSDFIKINAKKYEQDIVSYRPEIIVEILKGGPVSYARPKIADYPEIQGIINSQYSLFYATEFNKVYKLR